MRIEAVPMLELLWGNPSAPRSVTRCLKGCITRLGLAQQRNSLTAVRTQAGIEDVIHEIRLTEWEELLARPDAHRKTGALQERGNTLLKATLDIHHLIADGFLNHQIHMRPETQPSLFGLKNAI
jgi:hypothetical protein